MFSYRRDLNISFSVSTALNPEEMESALEATSYFTEDVTTEGNAMLALLTSQFRQESRHKSVCCDWLFLQGMVSWWQC